MKIIMEGQSSLRKQAKFSLGILCSSLRIPQSLMPNEHPERACCNYLIHAFSYIASFLCCLLLFVFFFVLYRTWNLVTGRSAYVTNIKEGIKNLLSFLCQYWFSWYSVPNGIFLSLHLAALIVKWSPLGDSYAVAVGNKVVVYKLAVSPSLLLYLFIK